VTVFVENRHLNVSKGFGPLHLKRISFPYRTETFLQGKENLVSVFVEIRHLNVCRGFGPSRPKRIYFL
jgi:hypothetical protein